MGAKHGFNYNNCQYGCLISEISLGYFSLIVVSDSIIGSYLLFKGLNHLWVLLFIQAHAKYEDELYFKFMYSIRSLLTSWINVSVGVAMLLEVVF